jgi:hypothetical protein
LPLFGASYTALIIIPAYVYLLGIYNQKIEAIQAWLSSHPTGEVGGISAKASSAALKYIHTEPIPINFRILFLSAIFLAIASTIYALFCPSRVKEFSRDQWCDELGRSLVHYWAEAWTRRWLRLACAVLYALGGVMALYVLCRKLYDVAVILWPILPPWPF